MSEWGDAYVGHIDLPHAHLAALDIIYNWFGGSVNRVDIFIASISASTMRDLLEEGWVRKRFGGWELTLKAEKRLAKL